LAISQPPSRYFFDIAKLFCKDNEIHLVTNFKISKILKILGKT